jgi:hypothetical protein
VLEKYELKCSGKPFQRTIQGKWTHNKIPILLQMVIYLTLSTQTTILITTAKIKILKY